MCTKLAVVFADKRMEVSGESLQQAEAQAHNLVCLRGMCADLVDTKGRFVAKVSPNGIEQALYIK